MSEDAQKNDHTPIEISMQDDEEHKPTLVEKGEIGELARIAVAAVFLALIIRALLLEPFNIPSSSMKPTLLIGDFLFVNKPAYGYSKYSFPFGIAPIEGRVWSKEPQRGDVIVFARPTDPSIDFIKRLIGLPGDTVQVKKGRLYINGKLIPRELVGTRDVIDETGRTVAMKEYIETLPGGVMHSIYEESDYEFLDNTEIFTVPEGHYFMMGDNRDNSQDSRVTSVVGYVPFENFVGRADFLFFSTNGYARVYEFWKWPWSIRFSRLFMDIDPVRLKQMDSESDEAREEEE